MAVVIESYHGVCPTYDRAYPPYVYGQTFTPTLDYQLQYIKLRMYKYRSPGDLIIDIQETDGSGLPNGVVLSTVTIPRADVPTSITWFQIDLPDIDIFANTMYAIVMKAASGSSRNAYMWTKDASGATYPRGTWCKSTNNEASWTKQEPQDFCFEVWGTPSAPPPPEYTDKKWFLKTFTPRVTCDGIHITLSTDVACHLFLRFSHTKPRIHKKTRVLRGQALLDDLRYCYVRYGDYEQDEIGDTLFHTFLFEPWPDCKWGYMYAWGTIDEKISPSTSCIMEQHRADVRCNDGALGDFQCSSVYHLAYSDAWEEAGSFYSPDDDHLVGYQDYIAGTGWKILRSSFIFPTWDVPKKYPVIYARLRFWVVQMWGTNPGPLILFYSYETDIPPSNAYYAKMRGDVSDMVMIQPGDVIVGGWNEVIIPQNWLWAINRGGLTWITLRGFWDWKGLAHDPAWGRSAGYAIHSANHATHKPHLLTISACKNMDKEDD